MGHSHNHHHHSEPLDSLNTVYYIAIALNLGYVVLEVIMGLVNNSLGLLSDAGHKLIDCFSLVIAMIAFALTKSKPTKKYTYGLRKSSIFISMVNALILIIAVIIIIIESIEKFSSTEAVNGAAISWTAAIGILVSGISAGLMLKHQKRDINTRGAFLHMATDVLVSLGVVASGIVISYTGWNFVDPIISIGIALMLLFNTARLFAESFRMCVDAVPDNICYDCVEESIVAVDGVEAVENLHIWPISINEIALTAHLHLSADADAKSVLAQVRHSLNEQKITEITLEISYEK